jgi:hypothetical protein
MKPHFGYAGPNKVADTPQQGLYCPRRLLYDAFMRTVQQAAAAVDTL